MQNAGCKEANGKRLAFSFSFCILHPASCILHSAFCISSSSPPAPRVDEARAFIARAEETLNTLGVRASRADWVHSTYITIDTQAIAAEAREAQIRAATQFAKATGQPAA